MSHLTLNPKLFKKKKEKKRKKKKEKKKHIRLTEDK